MRWQHNIWDIDMSLIKEMSIEDVRSYLICKYDIDTAKRIIQLLEYKIQLLWKEWDEWMTEQ